jgi:hypothetical protein
VGSRRVVVVDDDDAAAAAADFVSIVCLAGSTCRLLGGEQVEARAPRRLGSAVRPGAKRLQELQYSRKWRWRARRPLFMVLNTAVGPEPLLLVLCKRDVACEALGHASRLVQTPPVRGHVVGPDGRANLTLPFGRRRCQRRHVPRFGKIWVASRTGNGAVGRWIRLG